MATIEEFSRFPSFPPEIRLQIWKDAVHEEYRDRILMVDQVTHRIIVTRELQQPFRPIFHANRESREVANSMFPVRLAVYTTGWHGDDDGSVALGETPVSLKFDHFMIGVDWEKIIKGYFLRDGPPSAPLGSIGKFHTAELSLEQLGAVRHLIQAIKALPTRAAVPDPELKIDLSDYAFTLFGGVEVFRSFRMCPIVGSFCLTEKMSMLVNAGMIRLRGRTWNNYYGPSYNGRNLLHHEHFWNRILLCTDFQKRLQQARPGQE